MNELEYAKQLLLGLRAWKEQDKFIDKNSLAKAFRDNWDKRIGKEKFGGVWSISKARSNLMHPASIKALSIPRQTWKSGIVTVDHAIPIKIMFPHFMSANSDLDLQKIIDTYNVAIITYEENLQLRNLNLNSSMPKGWTWNDSPTIRWEKASIEVKYPTKI